jgi:hypothetical protein
MIQVVVRQQHGVKPRLVRTQRPMVQCLGVRATLEKSAINEDSGARRLDEIGRPGDFSTGSSKNSDFHERGDNRLLRVSRPLLDRIDPAEGNEEHRSPQIPQMTGSDVRQSTPAAQHRIEPAHFGRATFPQRPVIQCVPHLLDGYPGHVTTLRLSHPHEGKPLKVLG